MSDDIKAALAPAGRTLIITIGSELRADDGVGPFIGERLRFSGPDRKVINAHTTPESIAQDAINFRPDKIILIDAARFGGKPGETKVIQLEELDARAAVSTHSFPLKVTFGIVRQDTGADVVALGIEPGSLDFGEGLTPDVEKTALSLLEYFNNIDKSAAGPDRRE